MRALTQTIAAAVVVCSVLAFAFVLSHSLGGEGSDVTPPSTDVVSSAATTSLPMHLQIPALSIDAAVQHVGIAKSGAMAVPTNFTDVGWYRLGTVPGQKGSAVVDGHVDNGLALPGVFKHLSDINVGDSVYIQTRSGEKLHFVVYKKELYPYKDVPAADVFAAGDFAHLNLITCGGSWVQRDKTYDKRLVVYTKFVGV
jgi:sortase A